MASISDECEPCDECAICISDCSDDAVHLQCSHVFHAMCMGEYARRRLNESPGRSCVCPTCTRLVTDRELLDIFMGDGEAEHLLALHSAAQLGVQPQPNVVNDAAALKLFIKWAQAHHVKACPECASPIEKDGGCPRMCSQSCHHSFSWTGAPLLHPCRGYHHIRRYPFVKRCQHLPQENFTMRSGKAEYAVQKGLALAPLAAM